MANNPIRVLVVDDSALMRATIKKLLNFDPGIEVIDTAHSGPVALKKIQKQNPDVVTLDVEMPGMDGMVLLDALMSLHPLPVLMVSTLTQDGAPKTVEALGKGAVDCLGKPTGEDGQTLKDVGKVLIAKVKAAATAKIGKRKLAVLTKGQPSESEFEGSVGGPGQVIAVGASMGGPATLLDIFSKLPSQTPPILITQHMPKGFTCSFAERLNSVAPIEVHEAVHGDLVVPGRAFLAPGDQHMALVGTDGDYRIELRGGAPVCGHKPSVEVLFRSVAKAAGENGVGILMTGMGHDGAEGLGAFKEVGGRAFAQNEESAIVYGMPSAAKRLGTLEAELDLLEILSCLSGEPLPV
jgi:two-component system chemotaxis response regulator CheB